MAELQSAHPRATEHNCILRPIPSRRANHKIRSNKPSHRHCQPLPSRRQLKNNHSVIKKVRYSKFRLQWEINQKQKVIGEGTCGKCTVYDGVERTRGENAASDIRESRRVRDLVDASVGGVD